ncbi:MAG: 50S ribosomal protein L9 [Bacillota bacterium]
MEVILREDVEKVGSGGEIVDVADGYARNYLFPRGLAEKATESKIREVKEYQRSREKELAESRKQAEAQAKKLGAETFEIAVKAGEQGRLFGSVSTHDIAEKVEEAGYEIDRKKINLEENIKELGEHKVKVSLFEDVSAELTVNVVPKEA